MNKVLFVFLCVFASLCELMANPGLWKTDYE